MKLLAIATAALITLTGFTAAAVHEPDTQQRTNPLYEATISTMAVDVGSRLQPGLHEVSSDGNDIVLRKRPGRTKYGDITLKKGFRKCSPQRCGDDVGSETRVNKAELIEAIASNSGLSKADSKRALDAFADSSAKIQKKGDEVKLVGLGSFYSEHCKLQGAKEKAKRTACRAKANNPDYLDPDDDGDGISTGKRQR